MNCMISVQNTEIFMRSGTSRTESLVRLKMSPQEVGLSKFAWTALILQISFAVVYLLLVRYGESADAKHIENQLGKDHELEENLKKYPCKNMIVHPMPSAKPALQSI